MLDLSQGDPNAVAQLLEGFRKHFGTDKGLLDLEVWLESKLTILKRRSKRTLAPGAEHSVQVLDTLVREVRSRRFDIIARRCAMPRMTPW